jgi:hypothetical protein
MKRRHQVASVASRDGIEGLWFNRLFGGDGPDVVDQDECDQ